MRKALGAGRMTLKFIEGKTHWVAGSTTLPTASKIVDTQVELFNDMLDIDDWLLKNKTHFSPKVYYSVLKI